MERISLTSYIHAPIETVWQFHMNVENLKNVSPSGASIRILTPNPEIGLHKRISIEMHLWHLYPMVFDNEIIEFTPPTRFVDLQVKGPLRVYRTHAHFRDFWWWNEHDRHRGIRVAWGFRQGCRFHRHQSTARTHHASASSQDLRTAQFPSREDGMTAVSTSNPMQLGPTANMRATAAVGCLRLFRPYGHVRLVGRVLLVRLAALLLLIQLCVIGAAAGPGAAPGADATTTRVVSLVPNVTEILFTIGAGDQVVGTSDYCKYPPAALARPKLGGLMNPKLEALIVLKPTHVVLLNSQGDLLRKITQLGVARRKCAQ